MCDASSLSQIMLFTPGWGIQLGLGSSVCFSLYSLPSPFRLIPLISAHGLKQRLDAVVSQELRNLTKQHEPRVAPETFCPYHAQLCALCVCLFLSENKRLMDEIKKRDV